MLEGAIGSEREHSVRQDDGDAIDLWFQNDPCGSWPECLACLDIGDQPFQGWPLHRAAGKPAIIIERLGLSPEISLNPRSHL